MIKALLFDLDGTIADTNGLIFESFRHTLSSHGFDQVASEDIYKLFGEPLEASMGRYLPGEEATMVATYRAYNEACHDDMIRPFAQVEEVLQRLKAEGRRLAIVTSKRKEMALRSLTCLDLHDYFDLVVTPEDTSRHKPLPEPVLYALDQLKIQPKEALMIGDSPYDIMSGKAAGVPTVAVAYSKIQPQVLAAAKPTYTIKTMGDLIPLIQEAEDGTTR